MRRIGRLDNFASGKSSDWTATSATWTCAGSPSRPRGPAIGAAMELVAGTYALIIDCGNNGGGAPGACLLVQLPARRAAYHLNDIFHADTGETRQFWALPYVRGPATWTARSTC